MSTSCISRKITPLSRSISASPRVEFWIMSAKMSTAVKFYKKIWITWCEDHFRVRKMSALVKLNYNIIKFPPRVEYIFSHAFVILTLSLWKKSWSVTIQMKATEQYFPVVLFIVLYEAILTFESVDEILKCDHSNESYWAVLSCSAVYWPVNEILNWKLFSRTFVCFCLFFISVQGDSNSSGYAWKLS